MIDFFPQYVYGSESQYTSATKTDTHRSQGSEWRKTDKSRKECVESKLKFN